MRGEWNAEKTSPRTCANTETRHNLASAHQFRVDFVAVVMERRSEEDVRSRVQRTFIVNMVREEL